jgi:hypothetical protein
VKENGFNYAKHVLPFTSVHYHEGPEGYIVWRLGTGENVELLHIRGNGFALLKVMLLRLKDRPPYHTVFGFTRTGNWDALYFYKRAGFQPSNVDGVYKDGVATIFSAPYEELCKRYLS